MSSIYVNDERTLATNYLGAVRLYNGLVLPPLGLCLATARPLYVWGNFNQTNALNLGTTNTSTTLPCMLAGDAITLLSPAWTDANSTSSLSLRGAYALGTTLNAGILAGNVPTTSAGYSGGMENFVRYLESWTGVNFTYNGSMVLMYPSTYATNLWGENNVYDPPVRKWSFDFNFNNPVKLPPLTPSLQK